MSKTKNVKVRIDRARLAFVNLYGEPKVDLSGQPKWSVTLLFPKSDTVTKSRLEQAIRQTFEANKDHQCWKKDDGSFNKALYEESVQEHLQGLRIRNGDTKTYDGYAGNYFITVTKQPRHGEVALLKAPRQEFTPAELEAGNAIYSGVYCMVNVNCFFFLRPKPGVSFSISSLLKLEDAAKFGHDPASEFDDIDLTDLPGGEFPTGE